MKKNINLPYLGSAAILFAAFLWSIDAVMRQNLYSLPAGVIVFSEHTLGFLITLPWLIQFRSKVFNLDKKTWISIIWISIFGGLLGTLLYTTALGYVNYINLSVVVLLQKLQPIFAIFLARVILKERLKKNFYIYALLALIAGYLITFPEIKFRLIDGGQNLIAGILAIGAAFAWGSSTVMGKYSLRNLDTRVITPLRLGLTSVIALVYILIFGKFSAIGSITPIQFLFLLGIVFSSGTVALSIYYFGLKRVAASKSTILELFWPLSAVVIDRVFFGHHLTVTQILGAAILFFVIFKLKGVKTG